jgi:hypothetical protein
MIAYKLMRKRRDGSLGSLFINKKFKYPLNEWLVAEAHETKGYAFRAGFHCCLSPEAPHLSLKGRIWVKVEVDDYELYNRPLSQGGVWILAQRMMILGVVEYLS